MLELFDDVAAMKQVNAKFGLKNTPVIRAGDLYYCSGLTALDLDSGGITGGSDIREHARITLEDLEKILAEAGLGLDNVIKVNAYLADPVPTTTAVPSPVEAGQNLLSAKITVPSCCAITRRVGTSPSGTRSANRSGIVW